MSEGYGKTSRGRKRQRAERKLRKKLVGQVQRDLQLKFDKDEVLALLQGSLDVVAVELGRRVVVQFLGHEVEQLCGPRYRRASDRTATRYGHQSGFVCVGGQKLAIDRPRVRSTRADEGFVRTKN